MEASFSLLIYAIILAAMSAAQESQMLGRRGHGSVRESQGSVQPQPIGFRRIRIHRVRPGARTSTTPEGATQPQGAGDVDWGVEAITDDPYTFYHQNYQRRPGSGRIPVREEAEMDASERERHEQLQKMRLFQLRRELLRPSSRLQQPDWSERMAPGAVDNTNSRPYPSNNDTRNSTSPDGAGYFTRKRNCTTYNTTSGQAELCEDVNTTDGEEGGSDRGTDNREDWIVQER